MANEKQHLITHHKLKKGEIASELRAVSLHMCHRFSLSNFVYLGAHLQHQGSVIFVPDYFHITSFCFLFLVSVDEYLQ